MPTRVVVAEDEAIVRTDLVETLREEGYEVVGQTGRGDEAVELVRRHGADLAILDVKMPGLDGLAAARQISEGRGAAVVVLSAFSQRQLVEEARDAGTLAYLVKPFLRAELVAAIEVALGRFAEIVALESDYQSADSRLRARQSVERAKGRLMDRHRLSEEAAFSFLRRTAMSRRLPMLEVARQVLDGSLSP